MKDSTRACMPISFGSLLALGRHRGGPSKIAWRTHGRGWRAAATTDAGTLDAGWTLLVVASAPTDDPCLVCWLLLTSIGLQQLLATYCTYHSSSLASQLVVVRPDYYDALAELDSPWLLLNSSYL